MEARTRMSARMAGLVGILMSCQPAVAWGAGAAGYRTRNFSVSAPTPALAREICEAAEQYRRELAIEWIGKELPPWSERCPIHARVSRQLGAGGVTSFLFDRGQVYGWRMKVQGSRQRVLDSVLPHEVTHTIFATYFRQPLPRWADEGACTTMEHSSEIARMERMLIQFLKTRKGIPFGAMMLMKKYPPEMLPLYAQGHAAAEFLIEKRGKRAFLDFLSDGMRDDNWPRAVQAHYGYPNLLSLQNDWISWIRLGRPDAPAEQEATLIADARRPRPEAKDIVYRGQSPDRGRGRRLVTVAPRQRTRAAAPQSYASPAAPRTVPAAASSSGGLRERHDVSPIVASAAPQHRLAHTQPQTRTGQVLFEWRRGSPPAGEDRIAEPYEAAIAHSRTDATVRR